MTTTANPTLTRWFPQLQTVAAITGLHASRSPDTPAVECDGRVTTYAQLHRDSNRTANALLRAGLGRGSRVAYLGKESELYYELLFACAKAGAPGSGGPFWRLSPRHLLSISSAAPGFAGPPPACCSSPFRGSGRS